MESYVQQFKTENPLAMRILVKKKLETCYELGEFLAFQKNRRVRCHSLLGLQGSMLGE